MIVCPVCEHQQVQGAECEVCGKRLAAGVSAEDLAIPPVEGLEPTGHAPIDVPTEQVADIEPTLRAPAAAPAPDPTPDLEATRAAPVDVEVAPVPDVERTAAQADDLPTILPTFSTCRYCRTPALPDERICARCGMRLPVVAEQAAGAAAEASEHHTCSCGTPLRPGVTLCPSCGARVR
jgi:hypothetical protein